MPTFQHPTQYRFYYKPVSSAKADPKIDIEATYNCRYMKFSNLPLPGDPKNIYTEDFAEHSGVNVSVPEELAYKSTECKLKLLLKGSSCQENMRKLTEDLLGVRIEYSDTFRNRYATLLMTKAPVIVSERLYGNQQFIETELTFTNILGYTYATSKL